MNIKINPYIAGNPVFRDEQFIGRSDIIRDVEKTFKNPNSNAIVLFGQRRIGKTSILLKLEKYLIAKKEYTPIYFDLMDKASLPLREVLFQISCSISNATNSALIDKKHFDDSGQFFLEQYVPNIIKTRINQGIVLLFDEFDVLDNPKQENAGATFFPFLREWMRRLKQIQFIFVLGRRPNDLSTETLATFKAIRSRQVSLMSEKDTISVIRLSEKTKTMNWTDPAIEKVLSLTNGHPFLTQLLCSEVWENLVYNNPNSIPCAELLDVTEAVDPAIDKGQNAFQWIWDGLPPAERIVMSAMAECTSDVITTDNLLNILKKSKVRLILRELEIAPDILVKWDLLRPAQDGHKFAIKILQKWVAEEKPLKQVKADMDKIEPLADNLFKSAEGLYRMGNIEEAERNLRNSLNLNPSHFKAKLLLGQVFLGKGRISEAVKEFECAYEFDPSSSRSHLVRALLAYSEDKKEKDRIEIFNRLLEISPNQKEAIERKRKIIQKWAEEAIDNADFEKAINFFHQIDDQNGINRVKTIQRKIEIESMLANVQKYEEIEDWETAIKIYKNLVNEYSEDKDLRERLSNSEKRLFLSTTYSRALKLLDKDKDKSKELLLKILNIDQNYKEALEKIYFIVRGIDIKQYIIDLENKYRGEGHLKQSVSDLEYKYNSTQKRYNDIHEKLLEERELRMNIEKQKTKLKNENENISLLLNSEIKKRTLIEKLNADLQEEVNRKGKRLDIFKIFFLIFIVIIATLVFGLVYKL